MPQRYRAAVLRVSATTVAHGLVSAETETIRSRRVISARRMFHSEGIAVAYRFKSYSVFPFRRALDQFCSLVTRQKAAVHLGPKLGR